MDDTRFDGIAKAIASGTSRRALVKRLGGAVVGGLSAALVGGLGSAAAQDPFCAGPGEIRVPGRPCCPGLIEAGPRNAAGAARCVRPVCRGRCLPGEPGALTGQTCPRGCKCQKVSLSNPASADLGRCVADPDAEPRA